MAERDRTIRIAGGQGFWGDDLEAPVRQVERGPVDYLALDYLAEVTMSILRKQRTRDPEAGYARDFVPLMRRILPTCVDKGIRVLSNAGGVNPGGCAEAVADVAREVGLRGRLRVALVTGDDVTDRLEELTAQGHELRHMETGEPVTAVLDRVLSANAYLGAAPVVQALEGGADVVVSGRVADAVLTYAPMVHEFGWSLDDVARVSAGVVAGHLNECGAQVSGGNALADWWTIRGLDDLGFPVVEAEATGEFVVTKHPGTGGRVSAATVAEQLVYEVHDPAAYFTPDVVADFTGVELEEEGPDRVRVRGARGRPPTDTLKVSVAWAAGWKAVGTLVYAWPDAAAKARKADWILRRRLERLGLEFDEIRSELVGWNSAHGPLVGDPPPDLPEVQLRIGVRGEDRNAVERFTREIAPLVLDGPPTVTGFAGGRPRVSEVVAFWPALLDRSAVLPFVDVSVREV